MKTIATILLIAILTACGGEDSPDDAKDGTMPVTCGASDACG